MYDKDGNELEGMIFNDIRVCITNFDSFISSDDGNVGIIYNVMNDGKPSYDKKVELKIYSFFKQPTKSGTIKLSGNGDAKLSIFVTQNVIDHIKSCNKDASFTLEVYYNRKMGDRSAISTDLTGYAISPHNEVIIEKKKKDYSLYYAIGIFLIILLFLLNLYVLYQYIPQ